MDCTAFAPAKVASGSALLDKRRKTPFMRRVGKGAVALALTACFPTCRGATTPNLTNLVLDGSFESYEVGPGGPDSGYKDFIPGSTIGPNWRAVGQGRGAVAIYPNTELLEGNVEYNVPQGRQALDLTGDYDNGNTTIGVEQIIKTAPGSKYELSFYIGSTLGQAAVVNALLNGVNVVTASNSNSTPGATNWQQFAYLFTATGASTTLDLLNGSGPGVKTVGLDGVDVTPVTAPEPARFALVGTALLLAGAMRRKISNRTPDSRE